MGKGKSALLLVIFLMVITACSNEKKYISYEIGEAPDIPTIFWVNDLGFNLETGEIEGVDFNGKTEEVDLPGILEKYYDNVQFNELDTLRTYFFSDGFVSYDYGHGELGNGPHQIVLKPNGEVTMEDIRERYGTPTTFVPLSIE